MDETIEMHREPAGLRFLTASAVSSLMSVTEVADVLARGFRAREPAQLDGVPRSVLAVPDRIDGETAELLLMPAFGPEGAGLKLMSVVHGNDRRGLPLIQGLYVLLSEDGMTPELVIDGAALTRLRTAAVSALATRHLARADSRRLVVFGAGAQAAAHVSAMRSILPLEQVTIVGSAPATPRACALVDVLRAEGLEATLGTPEAAAEADVICTCTTSARPVLPDSAVSPGTHVNAIGAYRLDMAEIAPETLARALLVVESIAATLAEAGDVVAAIAQGTLPSEGFAHPLSNVVRGAVARDSADQITVFKSVGLSVEDLIVARALADAAPPQPSESG